jgi:hypothetical protein
VTLSDAACFDAARETLRHVIQLKPKTDPG